MTSATADPRQDAMAAAVPGARGWVRPLEGSGAINLRLAGSVQVNPLSDGFRLVIPEQGYVLAPGPYEDEAQAAAVCDALLALVYDDASWPTADSAAGGGASGG